MDMDVKKFPRRVSRPVEDCCFANVGTHVRIILDLGKSFETGGQMFHNGCSFRVLYSYLRIRM